MILVVVIIVIAAGVIVAVAGVFDRNREGSGPAVDNRAATSVATVQRRTLSTQTQFNGTLGYAGSYTVLGRGPGTVTWLPRPGQVIRNGQVLYEVDGAPIVLLHGSVPGLPRAGRGRDRGGRDRNGCRTAQPRPGRAGIRPRG